MSDKKTTVVFGAQKELPLYAAEFKELNQVLFMDDSGFTSDEASFWFHFSSIHWGIDNSAKNFWLRRMEVAFHLNFAPLFNSVKYPNLLDVLKYIRLNRGQAELQEIPSELRFWGGIKKVEESGVSEPVALSLIINLKEKVDYQKGLVLTSPGISASIYAAEEAELCRQGDFVLNRDDNTDVKFKCQQDIYYWLIASVSNDPRFKYEGPRLVLVNN